MLGSFRPPKRTQSVRQKPKKRYLNGYYGETKLENVIASLEVPLAHFGLRRSVSERHPRSSAILKKHLNTSKILKLNIGGKSFRFISDTIIKRCTESLLYKFVCLPHEERLTLCDYYFTETGEYFFQRSAQLFEPIYQYYITELMFWGIKEALFTECCWPQRKGSQNLSVEKVDDFQGIRMRKIRLQIWNLIEVPESSFAARIFAIFSIIAVLSSIAVMVISSVPDFQVSFNISTNNSNEWKITVMPHPLLQNFEYCCMGWFTTEYLAKMLVAPNKKHVFFQILNIIDLVAIAPFYFELILKVTGVDTESFEELNGALLMIRVLRVSRVIRIFKLGRYSSGLRAFARTLKASTKQLSMLTVVLMTGVMFFSTLVYSLEKDVPMTDFTSIPAAFWWCIVTMTTVGYGDMVPQTIAGKLVGSGAIACGVLVLALPITIIVDNFMKVHEHDQELPANHPLMRRKATENDGII